MRVYQCEAAVLLSVTQNISNSSAPFAKTMFGKRLQANKGVYRTSWVSRNNECGCYQWQDQTNGSVHPRLLVIAWGIKIH